MTLLSQMKRCNIESIQRTGDVDVGQLADLIEAALANPATRQAAVSELAEYAGAALDGCVLDVA
jgi:hypothetical protein